MNISVLYDISVLGMAQEDPRARTGIFRVMENLARGLVSSGQCELRFCTLLENGTACREYLATSPDFSGLLPSFIADLNGFAHLNTAARPGLWSRMTTGLIGLVKRGARERGGKQVFHTQYFAIPEYLLSVGHIACVQTIHDLIPVKMPHLFAFNDDDLIKRVLAKLGPETYVICMSESTRNDLLDYRHDLDPTRVSVVYSAASESFLPVTDPTLRSAVRRKYGIPADARYLLSVSTLEPRKNIDHVIRCFLRLLQQERLNDLYLVLTGAQGWKYDGILTEIEGAEEFRDRIILTGFVPDADLAPIYSGALGFVYLSLYEGFGLPPLEAMQCGTPVITSNTSSLPEVVGDAGVLLNPADSDALCQAFLNLYRNESLAAELSARSLARSAEFSWAKTVDETVAVYRKAASCG